MMQFFEPEMLGAHPRAVAWCPTHPPDAKQDAELARVNVGTRVKMANIAKRRMPYAPVGVVESVSTGTHNCWDGHYVPNIGWVEALVRWHDDFGGYVTRCKTRELIAL